MEFGSKEYEPCLSAAFRVNNFGKMHYDVLPGTRLRSSLTGTWSQLAL